MGSIASPQCGSEGRPVAADESARDPGVFSRRVCDAICLKIARCGGISGLVRDAAAARAAGYEVYLASTLDGPLGIAAALHAAAVVVPDRHCGLATLDRFDARIRCPPAPGRCRPRPARGWETTRRLVRGSGTD